jgi:hypothetical protein
VVEARHPQLGDMQRLEQQPWRWLQTHHTCSRLVGYCRSEGYPFRVLHALPDVGHLASFFLLYIRQALSSHCDDEEMDMLGYGIPQHLHAQLSGGYAGV